MLREGRVGVGFALLCCWKLYRRSIAHSMFGRQSRDDVTGNYVP